MHGMDGEDLGVELAKVAYDVKVNRQHSAALKAEGLTSPDICCRQAVSGVQGGDIRLLHVADLVYWTSYLVNAALCLSFMIPQSSKMSFSPCIEEASCDIELGRERQHMGCALLLATCRAELLHCVAVDGQCFLKAPASGGLSEDAAERAGVGAESQLGCLWKVGSHAHCVLMCSSCHCCARVVRNTAFFLRPPPLNMSRGLSTTQWCAQSAAGPHPFEKGQHRL